LISFFPKRQALVPLLALGTFAIALPACGDPSKEDSPPESSQASRQELTKALFDAESGASFDKALKKAQSGGVPEQTLLEARFLNLINLQDNSGIAALSPEMVARYDSFKLTESHIFGVEEEWQAVVHYGQALAALEKGNQADFKKHIQEAFWLSPRQAGIFAPHIEQLRLEEAMSKVRVDLDKKFIKQGSKEKVSLNTLAKKSPLILLHFWSPWSQECETFQDDFIVTANELTEKNVSVVSILADTASEIIPDANSYRDTVNKKTACFWILDDQISSFTGLLRIPDLPSMVLIDRTGKVLFNGHPSDKRLWVALKKVVPSIERPALTSP
jgi:hypothetical protein